MGKREIFFGKYCTSISYELTSSLAYPPRNRRKKGDLLLIVKYKHVECMPTVKDGRLETRKKI